MKGLKTDARRNAGDLHSESKTFVFQMCIVLSAFQRIKYFALNEVESFVQCPVPMNLIVVFYLKLLKAEEEETQPQTLCEGL